MSFPKKILYKADLVETCPDIPLAKASAIKLRDIPETEKDGYLALGRHINNSVIFPESPEVRREQRKEFADLELGTSLKSRFARGSSTSNYNS